LSGNPGYPADADPTLAKTVQSLSEQLNNAGLRSSSRVLILILLAMNKRSTASELRVLTGLGRGSLENHLGKLESVGYVKTKNVKSFGGWRQTVEITQAGLEECRELLRTIQALNI
jgi:DNA-binding MarR family transcriptional regulator